VFLADCLFPVEHKFYCLDHNIQPLYHYRSQFKPFILPWRMRLAGLFSFRIYSEIVNLVDSRWDSLDGESVLRKAATYTGQHLNRQTEMPGVGIEFTIPVLRGGRTHFIPSTARVQVISYSEAILLLHQFYYPIYF
jgi:hypothetical protein